MIINLFKANIHDGYRLPGDQYGNPGKKTVVPITISCFNSFFFKLIYC